MKIEQLGRSMIEMLGVLAIIGVLSVGGIAGYSKAMLKFRVNKTVDQVTQIATNVRTFFGSQSDYSDMSVKVLCKARLLPDEMIQGSCSSISFNTLYPKGLDFLNLMPEAYAASEKMIGHNDYASFIEKERNLGGLTKAAAATSGVSFRNAFGGDVSVEASGKSTSKDNRAFVITYEGIPEEACLELAVLDWGAGSGSGLVAFGTEDVKGKHVGDNSSGYIVTPYDSSVPMSPSKAVEACTTTNKMYWKFY